MYKKITLSCFLALASFSVFAQNLYNTALDKIVAVVGNNHITLSDVNLYFNQVKSSSDTIGEDYKCEIFYEMLEMKILNEQAFRDSVIVGEAEIERELDNRLATLQQNFGSKELMEKRMGKSVYQIKEENRVVIQEQLTARTMKGGLYRNVIVTPEEVKAYYNGLSDNERPFINATVEIGQIIINPKPSKEIEDYAKEKIEKIRQEIVEEGKDFAIQAGIYSQDPGSRDNGGFILAKKNELDPEFASNAFRLKDGEMSPVFRSGFGYHIIKMEKRTGDVAQLRHILVIPEVTSYDLEATKIILDSVRKELVEGRLTYNQAVDKYSNDNVSKGRGGIMFDLNTGSTKLTLDNLYDPVAASTIQEMNIGDYSEAHIFNNIYKSNAKAVRILYLKNRIDPHVANLEDDYTQFQQLTLIEKQNKYIKNYVLEKAKTMYLKLDPMFKDCSEVKDFYSISK